MDLSNENIIHIKKDNVEYIQFRKLLEYKNITCGSLNDIKISAKILDFNRVIDLLNKEINKDSTEDIVSIIKKGGLEEFVKGEKI